MKKWSPTCQEPLRLSSQAGVTLLEAMIGLTVLLIAIAGATAGYKQIVFARRSVTAGSSALEIDSAFSATVLQGLVNFIEPSACTDMTQLSNFAVGAFGNLNYQKSITINNSGALPVPADIQTAAARCGQTPTTNPAGQNASAIYACFTFKAAPVALATASKDAFVSSQNVFLEVYGAITDPVTGQPMSCRNAYLAASNPGTRPYGLLQGYYSLHWSTNSSTGQIYKSKVGVIYRNL